MTNVLDKNNSYPDAQNAIIEINKEIQGAGKEFEALNTSIHDVTKQFYKDLCNEIAECHDDPEISQKFEKMYVDVLDQWREDIHNIEVHIIKLSQWLKNEKEQGFTPKIWKLKRRFHQELFGSSSPKVVQKPLKRLQSGRNRSAKSRVSALHSDPSVYSSVRSPSKCTSLGHNETTYLTHVKVNRTMELRKAMTEKKRQEFLKKDPFYVRPMKRQYKSLQKYAKEDVYNRLTKTSTIAYDNQLKHKFIPKFPRYNSSSLKSLTSKTSSLVSTKKIKAAKTKSVKSSSAKYASSVNDKLERNMRKYRVIPTNIDPSSKPIQQGMMQKPISKIPRPISNRVPKYVGKAIPKQPNYEELKSQWKDLTNQYPPAQNPASDNFSDLKNSTGNAEKIYGKPKKTGKWTDFFRRNLLKRNKNEDKEDTTDQSTKDTKTKAKVKLKPSKNNNIKGDNIQPANSENLKKKNLKPLKVESNRNRNNQKNNNIKADTLSSEDKTQSQGEMKNLLLAKGKKPKSACIKPCIMDNSAWRELASVSPQLTSQMLEARKSKSDQNNIKLSTPVADNSGEKDVYLKRNHKNILSKLQQKKALDAQPEVLASVNDTKIPQRQSSIPVNTRQMKMRSLLKKSVEKKALEQQQKRQIIQPSNQLSKQNEKNTQQTSPYAIPLTDITHKPKPVPKINLTAATSERSAENGRQLEKTRNKPKSQMVRNTLSAADSVGVEEEYNVSPTMQHVFTKCSEELDSENDKMLAKLDERFNRQKLRVQNAVKQNQMDLESDEDTDEYDSWSEDDDSDGPPPQVRQQTLLLKQHINKMKQELLNSTLKCPSPFTGRESVCVSDF